MDYRETIITGSDFTKMGATETKDYVLMCYACKARAALFTTTNNITFRKTTC